HRERPPRGTWILVAGQVPCLHLKGMTAVGEPRDRGEGHRREWTELTTVQPPCELQPVGRSQVIRPRDDESGRRALVKADGAAHDLRSRWGVVDDRYARGGAGAVSRAIDRRRRQRVGAVGERRRVPRRRGYDRRRRRLGREI